MHFYLNMLLYLPLMHLPLKLQLCYASVHDVSGTNICFQKRRRKGLPPLGQTMNYL